jgi:hypothetical protein
MSDIPIQLVEKLELQAGDLLHVRVGLTSEELGGDQPPWIPGDIELAAVQEEWDCGSPGGRDGVSNAHRSRSDCDSTGGEVSTAESDIAILTDEVTRLRRKEQIAQKTLLSISNVSPTATCSSLPSRVA